MRARLFAAALLCTTALTPARAEAAPVLGFVAGLFGAGTAFGAGLGAYAAGASVAGFFGTLGGRLLLGIGLAALSAALTPTPALPKPSDRMASFAQPIAYMETVYGRTRKAGPLAFTGFRRIGYWRNDSTSVMAAFPEGASPAGHTLIGGGKLRVRMYGTVLAAHPIEGVHEHWLDERLTTLDADRMTASPAALAGYGRVTVYTGQPGQAADPDLVNVFAGWTSAHDMKGLSYAVLTALKPDPEDFSAVYPRGREWAYAPVIDGHSAVYDPRDETEKFTANAALVLAHWITEVLGRDVDWAAVATEADICDATVTNAEAATQPRWQINGTISDEMSFEDQRAQLCAACDAFLFERPDGKVGFYVGRYIAPTVTLGADDCFSVEIAAGHWGADAVTEVAATYSEPENGWRETPSGAWVIEAASAPTREEPALYLISSHNQAARLNKRLSRVKRSPWQVRASLGLIGYELIGQRFVRLTHAELGFDEVLEISRLTREGPGLFTLEARAVAEEDFAFDAAVEEPARPSLGTSLGDVRGDSVVTNIAALATDSLGNILVTWDALGSDERAVIRHSVAGEANWTEVPVPLGATAFSLLLVPGEDYDIQIQARSGNLSEPVSDWLPSTPVTVGALRYLADYAAGSYQIDQVPSAQARVLSLARASTGTFRNASGTIETAAANVARLDYAGGVGALLVEPAATNQFQRSQDIGNAYWTRGGVTVSADSSVAPDGTTTMDRLVEDTSTGQHFALRTMPVLAGETWCQSVFVRAAGRTNVQLTLQGTTGGVIPTPISILYNLATGAASILSGSPVSYGMEPFGANVWRLWVSGSIAANGNIWATLFLRDATANSYTGDGVSGIDVWGRQFEAGGAPTSYIPTVAAAVTRAADVPALDGLTATLDLSAIYGDGTTESFPAVAVTPGATWPALTQTRLRRLIGRTP